VFPGQTAGAPAPTVSEWAKVRIDATGAVFVNKKRMTADEFRTECARLKKVRGAVVLFVEAAYQVANSAQADKIRLIADTGVPMKMALKESELD
jgi:biopolymer transport protein ExbD